MEYIDESVLKKCVHCISTVFIEAHTIKLNFDGTKKFQALSCFIGNLEPEKREQFLKNADLTEMPKCEGRIGFIVITN